MELKETSLFPGAAELSPQIKGIINKVHSPSYIVELLDKKSFDYRSTSPAEVINCRLNNGEIVSLFCKYSGTHTRYSYGHRGGVKYETQIYKNILQAIPLNTARFYGSFDQDDEEACLVLQYLEGSKLLKDQHDPVHFAGAASWIGSLHKMYQPGQPVEIKIYDRNYYLIWLNGVEKISLVLKEKHPWLPGVCNFFREKMDLLSGSAATFIHGEYYTKNILVHNDVIYPIDWESAAIGPGEIDLASLMDGWDDERKNIALKNYVEARWPDGNFSENEFRERLLLAKIYLFLRWTGEYDDPGLWSERTNWFENFHEKIRNAGYRPLAE